MKLQTLICISAFSGCCWGLIAVSEIFLNDATGVNSQMPAWAAMLAGAITGTTVGILSRPAYRIAKPTHLLWIAPLSMYFSIGCFITLALSFSNRFQLDSIIETALASWWALTFVVTLWPFLIFAYLNHRWLWQLAHREEQDEAGNPLVIP